MPPSRQLAAIMFTDIVGYTALTGNDEQNAFSILAKNRELQKPIIVQFNGRWIKELGDGVLSSFNTDELLPRSQTESVSGLFLSGVAYYSKSYDQAFEFLEQAFEQHDCTLPFIKNYPPCSYIKTDPGFQTFIKRMNYPE